MPPSSIPSDNFQLDLGRPGRLKVLGSQSARPDAQYHDGAFQDHIQLKNHARPARQRSRLICILDLTRFLRAGRALIFELYVDPEKRRRGIARLAARLRSENFTSRAVQDPVGVSRGMRRQRHCGHPRF